MSSIYKTSYVYKNGFEIKIGLAIGFKEILTQLCRHVEAEESRRAEWRPLDKLDFIFRSDLIFSQSRTVRPEFFLNYSRSRTFSHD